MSEMKKTWAILAFAACVALAFSGCSSDDEPVVEEEIDPPGAPPKTWDLHGDKLKRAFYDDDVAIYVDGDMDPKITWMYKFTGDMWRHIKEQYQCTPDQRLFAILHGKGGGGTASYYYSDSYDYRNVIDCSSDSWEEARWPHDLITHEMFHVVETVSFGAHSNSAGYGDYPGGIWGDSQFAPIFQYDLYKTFGMEDEAKTWENFMKENFSNKPTPETYWSRNWFFPIYQNYGKKKVLVNFFKLVGEHFPENRKLNIGEFVHFFSGAANADLKEYAVKTFSWPQTYENELVEAKKEFPMIKY
jgi:hypothetical protein